MLKYGLKKSDALTHPARKLVVLKHKCLICRKQDHNWQQVYTENNSILNKIENTYISWCNLQNDYVLITKK